MDSLPPRVTLPPPPSGRKRRLSFKEAAQLLDAARQDDERRRRSLLEPLVALLVSSGLRLSEALELRWGSDGLDLRHEPALARIGRAKTPAGIRDVTLERDTCASYVLTGSPAAVPSTAPPSSLTSAAGH